jgi:transposase
MRWTRSGSPGQCWGCGREELCWPRSTGIRTAIRVLLAGRDQMATERTRTINALTALVRSVDLGVDARKALTVTQVATITGWRSRDEDRATAACRREAIRLAGRIRALERDLATNKAELHQFTTAQAPELLALSGVGPVVAGAILLAWSHPGRVRSEAAFAVGLTLRDSSMHSRKPSRCDRRWHLHLPWYDGRHTDVQKRAHLRV